MKFKRTLTTIGRIELAPMVDVVFLLVIYFLVASTLDDRSSIPVNLPKSKQATSKQTPNRIIITVNKKNRIFLGNSKKAITLEKLGDKVTKLIEDSKNPEGIKKNVVIRGDEVTHYRTIVAIMDELSLRNIKNFNLSVRRKNKR